MYGLKPKTAKNNKFVENGLGKLGFREPDNRQIGFDAKKRKITEVC